MKLKVLMLKAGMNKKIFWLELLISVFILLLTSFNNFVKAEMNIPKPVGYINDFANVISPEGEQKLDSIARELKEKTGSEIAVITINSLEGNAIEDVSLEIGRKWGVGQKGKDNGALILVAPFDRKLRIEIGYGLEQYVTDSAAGRIRDNYMVPYFRQNDYERGITYGTMALVNKIANGYGVTISGMPKTTNSSPRRTSKPDFMTAIIFLFVFILLSRRGIFFLGPMSLGSSSGFGGGGFGGFGGGDFGGGGASGDW